MIANSHQHRKRQENMLNCFTLLHFVCATIKNLPVVSCLFFCECTRPAASMRPPCLNYLSTSTGVRTGCHYLISVCVRNIRRIYWLRKSCTRPISTNPGSIEADEYGLTRATCFVPRRLEVVAGAGLLWISWCVLGGADFSCFSFSIFFFERTRPAVSMRPPCLIYLSTTTSC